MSAYQIAIRFAETHQLPQAEIRELARRIAFFLSKAVKDKEPGIEGGFISHEFIGSGPWFVDSKGQGIRPSRRVREHSIFRWVPKAAPHELDGNGISRQIQSGRAVKVSRITCHDYFSFGFGLYLA